MTAACLEVEISNSFLPKLSGHHLPLPFLLPHFDLYVEEFDALSENADPNLWSLRESVTLGLSKSILFLSTMYTP